MRQAVKYFGRGAAGNRRCQIFRHSDRRPVILCSVPDVRIDADVGKRVFPGLDISPDVSNVASDAANKARPQYLGDAGLKLSVDGQGFIVTGGTRKQQAK